MSGIYKASLMRKDGGGGQGVAKMSICATCFPKCFRFFLENCNGEKLRFFLNLVNQIELNNYE